jgi:hypothetical protein
VVSGVFLDSLHHPPFSNLSVLELLESEAEYFDEAVLVWSDSSTCR